MAIAFGDVLGSAFDSGVNSITLTTLVDAPSGSLIVGGVGLYKAGSVLSLSISDDGEALTYATDQFVTPYSGDTNYTVAIFSALSPSTLIAGTNITIGWTGGGAAFAITACGVFFTGMDVSTPLDAVGSGSGGSLGAGSTFTTSVTSTNPDDVIVGYAWVDFSAGTASAGTGWTDAIDFQNTIDSNTAILLYQIVTGSAGTHSPNGAFSGGNPFVAVAAAYKAAGGGPPPPTVKQLAALGVG